MSANTNLLGFLFNPRSISLVGASHSTEKLGGAILKNLLKFKGRVYPVNPLYKNILGLKTYPSIKEIPEPVDISIIIRPAHETPEILMAHKGMAKCAIIISSGFAETGETQLQEDIKNIAKEAGVRVLGPNCMGVYNPYKRLDTFFLPDTLLKRPKKGNVAVTSQSGAILSSIFEAMRDANIGISKAVGYGNAIDIDEADLYGLIADDKNTDVVISYIESLGDGRRFIESAKNLSKKKPLIILKSGKGLSGQFAAYSHTGRLAGRYEVFSSILRQFGIKETEDFGSLIDSAKALAYQGQVEATLREDSLRGARGKGHEKISNRVLIITNGGGSGVLAVDECIRQGLDNAHLPQEKIKRLKEIFPPFYGINNPLDLTAQVKDEDYLLALNELKDDYDGLLIIALTGVRGITEKLGWMLKDFKSTTNKPIVVHAAAGATAKKIASILEKSKIPVYPSPEQAVRALKALLCCQDVSGYQNVRLSESKDNAFEILKNFIKTNKDKRAFLEHEVKGLLKNIGFPIPRGIFIAKDSRFSAVSHELSALSYPLAAKVSSSKIVSKTEAGGLRLGLKNETELENAVNELMNIKNSEGVLVEEMAAKGLEVIIGGIIDEQFGPVVMFGLGGVSVELFKDVAFALAPLEREDAEWLIKQIKGYPLLQGYRGQQPLDMDMLIEMIAKVSNLIATGLIKEITLNPAVLYPKGAMVLDAKMLAEAS
ncbi:MAG: acetate--CoA ligase family protein [Nitrospirae bacterium]|nr:acetate--CoA ligase family protein [Nitrospirota bacterium]